MRNILFFIVLLLFASCKDMRREKFDPQSDTCQYASLLNLSMTDEAYTLVQIFNPWQSTKVEVQYLLVPTDDTQWNEQTALRIKEEHGEYTLLRTPLQHMTLTSSCHAWLLGELSALDHVSVMCDTAYVMAPSIRQWLRNSEVADGGNSMDLNKEVLLASQTDAVWISPYENTATSTLSHLPLTLIYCADYMETSPLGRAEWLRFYGRLVGKGHEADSLFLQIQTRYDSLANVSKIDSLQPRQTLLAELPYGPTWYIPGGCSTSALLYKDAGYDYFWANDTHAGSLSLSPEAVLAKAMDCDRWIFKYMNYEGDWTLEEFLQQNPYYSQFKAAKNGEIWGCNTSYSDFFDITPFRPDILLESLINNDERFFKQLK